MTRHATPTEIYKALDPTFDRYELHYYPQHVVKSPPVTIPPAVPEVCFTWAAVSTAWCLALGRFDWSAVLFPGVVVLSIVLFFLLGMNMVYYSHDAGDFLRRISIPVWRGDKEYRIRYSIPTSVVTAYANEGYRDLAVTYITNREAIEDDPLLEPQHRAELHDECLEKFEEAVERRREVRRETLKEYIETWRECIDNYNT